ncbi:hypothetical protein [Synoicihabitans lomoniglobus]|nr:hypothetical protein [Opitutaceae bacterium LMO-M01]
MADSTSRIPLVHLTDLYHPAQDPDDQFDLATVLALPEYDLRAVILDTTERFRKAAPAGWDVNRDPGLVIVTQASYLIARAIPVAVGPEAPLTSVNDDARSRPSREQAGIELLLETLRAADAPVVVSIVGSARVLTAAFNRDPALVREKVRSVLLNAGTTVTRALEWNVQLDAAAFIGLWRSGLPVHWYPCATDKGAFDPKPERGTHWSASHEQLLAELSPSWRAWFAYGLSGSARGDFIGALADLGRGSVWENILAGRRSLWSTVSLVMGAGRGLAKTAHGWRFVPRSEITTQQLCTWPLRLDPISAKVGDDAQVAWSLATAGETSSRLFGRTPGADYGAAMAEALNALLRTLPE